MADTCTRCDGCGQIADTDEGEPWSYWANLPVQSATAVLVGIVKPIPCPKCGGAGVTEESRTPKPPTKREVRDAVSLALSGEWMDGLPEGWDVPLNGTSGDSAIHLTINGREFLVLVSIPQGARRPQQRKAR